MEKSQRKIGSYMYLSIINMFCCCPLGVLACICSLRVKKAEEHGDMERAAKASRTAKILNIIGIITGIVTILIVIGVYILGTPKKRVSGP